MRCWPYSTCSPFLTRISATLPLGLAPRSRSSASSPRRCRRPAPCAPIVADLDEGGRARARARGRTCRRTATLTKVPASPFASTGGGGAMRRCGRTRSGDGTPRPDARRRTARGARARAPRHRPRPPSRPNSAGDPRQRRCTGREVDRQRRRPLAGAPRRGRHRRLSGRARVLPFVALFLGTGEGSASSMGVGATLLELGAQRGGRTAHDEIARPAHGCRSAGWRTPGSSPGVKTAHHQGHLVRANT